VCIVGRLRGERIRGCFTPLTPSSVVVSTAIFHMLYVKLVSAITRVLQPVRSVVVSETVLKPAVRSVSRRRSVSTVSPLRCRRSESPGASSDGSITVYYFMSLEILKLPLPAHIRASLTAC
jgi:hypothetical protein